MQTPENFRSLAAILLADDADMVDEPAFEVEVEDASTALGAPHFVRGRSIPHDDTNDDTDEELELLRDMRLFHARVIEAVETAVETLVEGIAGEVLARELLLAPAEIETIVDRALARCAAEEPVRVRVHPDDASSVQCGVPLIADAALQRGDAMIELRNGTVDASLGVRLDALLGAVR